jgi:hypothetical protein
MFNPWKRRARGEDADLAREVISWYQRIFAWQQLSMEVFNDAAERSAAEFAPGDELFVRGGGMFSDLNLVREHVLPALNYKNQIAATMAALLAQLELPDAPRPVRKTQESFRAFLVAFGSRALVQAARFKVFVDGGNHTGEAEQLVSDARENAAAARAIEDLNALVRWSGLSTSTWLEVNRGAFNGVREKIGLAPLEPTDFQQRFIANTMGLRSRFFDGFVAPVEG